MASMNTPLPRLSVPAGRYGDRRRKGLQRPPAVVNASREGRRDGDKLTPPPPNCGYTGAPIFFSLGDDASSIVRHSASPIGRGEREWTRRVSHCCQADPPAGQNTGAGAATGATRREARSLVDRLCLPTAECKSATQPPQCAAQRSATPRQQRSFPRCLCPRCFETGSALPPRRLCLDSDEWAHPEAGEDHPCAALSVPVPAALSLLPSRIPVRGVTRPINPSRLTLPPANPPRRSHWSAAKTNPVI